MEEAEVGASEELSDETLFARVRAGDQESLAVLIQRHETRLFSLLVRLTGGDRNLADDLFQETFLRAVRAARTFDADKAFRPWVTAIAVNLFRDEARRRKIRGEVNIGGDENESPAGQPEGSGEAPHEAAERKDEAARVNASLTRLTEKERTVILLHFYDQMTLSEVSETLDIPVGTVKSRLHSALTRLRQLLERSP
jgi:RNA polymerase sigma-70 factor (ECF subfamily)